MVSGSGISYVSTSTQTDYNASTPPLSFLHARCPSCCPTNSAKALKAQKEMMLNINLLPAVPSVTSSLNAVHLSAIEYFND